MTTSQDLQAEYAEAWANLEEAKRKMVELCRRIGPGRWLETAVSASVRA